MSAATGLAGLRVLVTRPAHQAGPLCSAIEAAGGHSLRQPLLAIKAPADRAAAVSGLAQAGSADSFICTSANAVEWAWQLVPDWAPAGHAYAVGRSTAGALERRLQRAVTVPATDYSSEGLLALPELQQLHGRKLCIITGEHGRGILAQTLRERSALVQQVEVYRRENIPVARARLQALLNEVDVIFVSSGASLRHLFDITPVAMRRLLLKLQLVVPSSRVLKLALDLGFMQTPLRPERMQDDAVVAVLQNLTGRVQARPGLGQMNG